MGEVYEQFKRDLEGWREKYRDNPAREILHLLFLALEREAVVATSYRDQVVVRRLYSMPLSGEIRELIRHALIWAWKDEEMHAIYIRGVIFKMGSTALRMRAFLKQMSGVMRQPIDTRIVALQPARQYIDSQRKAVHLSEQRNDEGAERAEGAPVPLCLRFEEGESEEDENGRVDEN